METEKPTIINQGMKFGLILGFVQILVQLCLYMIDKSLLVSFWVGVVMLLLSIVLMVWPVRSYKKMGDGVITFKDAFIICIVTIAGGALLTTVFNYLLYNVIDPSLADFIKEKAIETMTSMMEKFGGSQEDIERGIESIEKQDFSQSPARLGTQYISGILFGAIPALIIAAIMRTKTQPVDDIQ